MSEVDPQELASAAPAAAAPHMYWFIVHTYSGFEDRVVTELQNRIESLRFLAPFRREGGDPSRN